MENTISNDKDILHSREIMMLFMLVVVCSTGACGSRGSTPTAEESINQEEFKEIKWPASEIVQLLPQPKSNIGKIDMETSSAFYVYIGNTSEDEIGRASCRERV